MIGYNSREIFQDATYDVQTQQLNGPERSIETHVYRNGKIVSTVRSDIGGNAPVDSLEGHMSRQHEEVCGKVREGTYELVFLWISRGIIAFESLDYLQALECFESVLTIEETHAEANAYLDKIQSSLKKDPSSRRRVLQGYERQIEALESSHRILEAGRKRAILARICHGPPSSKPRDAGKREAVRRRFPHFPLLENSLARIRKSLVPIIRESLLPAMKKKLPRRIREDWIAALRHNLVPRIRDTLLPKIRAELLPKIRENLLSKYVLVTLSTVLLMILSGLIAADFQVKLDPAYHASLGKEYLEDNRISQARNLFYGILRQEPTSREALEGFWATFSRQGGYQEAGDMLAELLVEGRDPAPQIDFYLAEAYRLSSRCAEAIPHYERALAQGFPELPCAIGKGLCLLERQSIDAAIELWEGLLERGTDDFRVDYCLGRAYQANGRLGRASVHYSRALQKQPEASPIYRALGECLYGMHQEKRAEALWEKAALLESAGNREAAGHPPGPMGSDKSGPGPAAGRRFPFPLI